MSPLVRFALCAVLAIAAALFFALAVLAAGGDTGAAIAGALVGWLFGGLAAALTTGE